MRRNHLLVFLMAIMLIIPHTIIGYADDSCQHDWSGWKTTTKATVFKKGKAERECSICGAEQVKETTKLKAYAKISKKSKKLKAGKSFKLKVKKARGDKVKKWTSSNKRVATVSKSGKVKARRAGTAKITVRLKSGKKASCKVRVKKAKKKKKKSKSGGRIVYWVANGKVYHRTSSCRTLSRSRTIYKGTVAESGKSRKCKVCW